MTGLTGFVTAWTCPNCGSSGPDDVAHGCGPDMQSALAAAEKRAEEAEARLAAMASLRETRPAEGGGGHGMQ